MFLFFMNESIVRYISYCVDFHKKENLDDFNGHKRSELILLKYCNIEYYRNLISIWYDNVKISKIVYI